MKPIPANQPSALDLAARSHAFLRYDHFTTGIMNFRFSFLLLLAFAYVGISTQAQAQHALLLVPVDITVRKKGDPTPADGVGVLVKENDILQIAFAPSFFDKPNQFQNLIAWKWRELLGDGSFTEWSAFGANESGTFFEDATLTSPGIYQIKAIVTTSVSGNQTQDYPYIRKKDDPYGADSYGTFNPIYKKGQPDYVGIATSSTQIAIVKTAQKALGSTAWAESGTITLPTGCVAGPGLPKCNFFDYQMVIASGSTMPVDAGGAPPRAYDIWNSSFAIAGWAYHGGAWYPTPGSLAARYKGTWHGITFHISLFHAHTGILDYDGAWINAGSANVNRYPHPTIPEYGSIYGHYRSN